MVFNLSRVFAFTPLEQQFVPNPESWDREQNTSGPAVKDYCQFLIYIPPTCTNLFHLTILLTALGIRAKQNAVRINLCQRKAGHDPVEI